MNASNLSALNRVALWFAPYVCLPLFLMHPAKAGPTPQTSAAASVVVVMPLAAPEAPAPAPAVETVHVVLTRGPMRLELDLPVDGKVAPDTADEIARIMRDPASGRMRRIASGTLALLADVAMRYPGHDIEVVSAVRAEPDRTREGIKHSKHWDGHAIDLIVRDAKLAEVRDEMWKNHHDIGVGWYPEGGFIHIDYRPDVHDMAWTQPRKNADNVYHPRWSLLARDPDIQLAASRAAMRHLLVKIATALGYTDAGAHQS